MKFTLLIDKSREQEVKVFAHKKSSLTDAIEKLVSDEAVEMVGYIDREAVMLDLISVNCFVVENNKIFALTNRDKLSMRLRLYQLEEKLPDIFIKINQSCIANIKQIRCFDASISGTLKVIFKNGHEDYVSRRQLKSVKERLGL